MRRLPRGLSPEDTNKLDSLLEKRHGLILVTGLAGNGKTTTLHDCLTRLDAERMNVMTLENPVKYRLSGVAQVECNRSVGLDYSAGLRAFTYQDPDVIMVGGLTDPDTLHHAISLALSGSLVLAALPAGDAAEAITRLLEIGLDPFLCASTLTGVLAQHLVRTICGHCKVGYFPSSRDLREVGLDPSTRPLYRGQGCDRCGMTGYQERTGVFELLVLTDPLRRLMLQRAAPARLRQAAVAEGLRTLLDEVRGKMLAGVTTLQEYAGVLQATPADSWETSGAVAEPAALAETDELERIDEPPIVRGVNLIISQAINDGASYIHIEQEAPSVRYRVDGVLYLVMSPPQHVAGPLVARIKALAHMDIFERRVPQAGGLALQHDGRAYSLRVHTVPTVHGEKVVIGIRLKAPAPSGPPDLQELGLPREMREEVARLIRRRQGLFLLTGPGKSTTGHACLVSLASGDASLYSIQEWRQRTDYALVNVGVVRASHGWDSQDPWYGGSQLTFLEALRGMRDRNPTAVMVEELRNPELWRIGLELALECLVLTTSYSNGAGGVASLVEMGLEPSLCASAVNGVLTQRLLRTLCSHCKEAYTPFPEVVEAHGLAPADGEARLYRARGCKHCDMTGYRGRTGIFELLVITDRIRQLIELGAEPLEIRQAALQEGLRTLREEARRKVGDGLISLEDFLLASLGP